MDIIWAVLLTALLVFCFGMFVRLGYSKGYKAGAQAVTNIWRLTMMEAEEMKNEK